MNKSLRGMITSLTLLKNYVLKPNCDALQLRRPLLSIPKTEPRGRSGARLSTTRRSIQPKNKPLGNSTRVSV